MKKPAGWWLTTADLGHVWLGHRADCPGGVAPTKQPQPRFPPLYPDRLSALQVARAIYRAGGPLLVPQRVALP